MPVSIDVNIPLLPVKFVSLPSFVFWPTDKFTLALDVPDAPETPQVQQYRIANFSIMLLPYCDSIMLKIAIQYCFHMRHTILDRNCILNELVLLWLVQVLHIQDMHHLALVLIYTIDLFLIVIQLV